MDPVRSYDKGVLVGEIDPPPAEPLEQWLRQEIVLARGKMIVKIDSAGQLTTNASLSARVSALTEVLYEMEKRAR